MPTVESRERPGCKDIRGCGGARSTYGFLVRCGPLFDANSDANKPTKTLRGWAAVNVMASLAVGLAAVWLGTLAGRQV